MPVLDWEEIDSFQPVCFDDCSQTLYAAKDGNKGLIRLKWVTRSRDGRTEVEEFWAPDWVFQDLADRFG